VSLTSVIYLVSDLLFGTAEAVVAAAIFFAFVAWRWWAYGVARSWSDRSTRA
jgi:hypothetical protein